MKTASLLISLLTLPLHSPEGWRLEKFGSVTPNQVTFSEQGMLIKVNESSSPLFYPLSSPKSYSALRVKGSLSALPKLDSQQEEGIQDNDDFALRVGLILEGDDGPNWIQRIFAPGWIKRILASYPENSFSQVKFYVVSQRQPAGTVIPGSTSRWISQQSALQKKDPGPFEFETLLDVSKNVLGVWIQADGDNSHSKFNVEITQLELIQNQP